MSGFEEQYPILPERGYQMTLLPFLKNLEKILIEIEHFPVRA
jgi:hypothetical protein